MIKRQRTVGHGFDKIQET